MSAPRPFAVLGIQQIAVGARDKRGLRHLWLDLLGLTRKGEFRSESENVDEDIAQAGAGPFAAEVDLMQTAITQPAMLTADTAIYSLLGEYGFQPDMVMGHSLGEYGALIAAELDRLLRTEARQVGKDLK